MNYNNLAQATNFIAGSDKFEKVPFYLTSVNIPGVNVQGSEVGGRGGTSINLSGGSIEFNRLAFEMLIDEDFLIYQELMDVIRENVNVPDGTFDDLSFDFFVEVSNSKGHKVLKMDFYNCRIESISDIFLNTQDDGTEYILGVDLVYDYFETQPINKYKMKESPKESPMTLITTPIYPMYLGDTGKATGAQQNSSILREMILEADTISDSASADGASLKSISLRDLTNETDIKENIQAEGAVVDNISLRSITNENRSNEEIIAEGSMVNSVVLRDMPNIGSSESAQAEGSMVNSVVLRDTPNIGSSESAQAEGPIVINVSLA